MTGRASGIPMTHEPHQKHERVGAGLFVSFVGFVCPISFGAPRHVW